MRRTLSTRQEELDAWQTIFAGGTAGLLHWLVAMPIDTVKSRFQSGIFSKR